MRYAVFGPREVRRQAYTNYAYIASTLATFPDLSSVVLGGGQGVELLAERWAKEAQKPYSVVRPDIKNSKSVYEAFRNRNEDIIRRVNKVVVFTDVPHLFLAEQNLEENLISLTLDIVRRSVMHSRPLLLYPI